MFLLTLFPWIIILLAIFGAGAVLACVLVHAISQKPSKRRSFQSSSDFMICSNCDCHCQPYAVINMEHEIVILCVTCASTLLGTGEERG